VVLADLVVLYKDYTVAVVVTGTQPGEAQNSWVDTVSAGRYDKGRAKGAKTVYKNHEKRGDKTEGWRMSESSPHSLRGRDLAFHSVCQTTNQHSSRQ